MTYHLHFVPMYTVIARFVSASFPTVDTFWVVLTQLLVRQVVCAVVSQTSLLYLLICLWTRLLRALVRNIHVVSYFVIFELCSWDSTKTQSKSTLVYMGIDFFQIKENFNCNLKAVFNKRFSLKKYWKYTTLYFRKKKITLLVKLCIQFNYY